MKKVIISFLALILMSSAAFGVCFDSTTNLYCGRDRTININTNLTPATDVVVSLDYAPRMRVQMEIIAKNLSNHTVKYSVITNWSKYMTYKLNLPLKVLSANVGFVSPKLVTPKLYVLDSISHNYTFQNITCFNDVNNQKNKLCRGNIMPVGEFVITTI